MGGGVGERTSSRTRQVEGERVVKGRVQRYGARERTESGALRRVGGRVAMHLRRGG